MIKRGAVIGSLGGRFAFKMFDDNTAKKIAITTGAKSVEYVELTSGVAENDQIIISDYQDFNHADQIHLTD
jgi:HlyD family secretion protein